MTKDGHVTNPLTSVPLAQLRKNRATLDFLHSRVRLLLNHTLARALQVPNNAKRQR
jgi:hypothetical protein